MQSRLARRPAALTIAGCRCLSHLRTRVVSSDNFGWADEIPKLIKAKNGAAEPELVTSAATGKSGAEEGIWPRWETGLVRGTA